MILYQLKTTGLEGRRPEHYLLVEYAGGVFLRSGNDFSKRFPSMTKALFCLGGMMDFEMFDENSKAVLLHLNNGRAP